MNAPFAKPRPFKKPQWLSAPGGGFPRWFAPTVTTIVVIVLADVVVRSGLILRRAFATPPEIARAL